VLGVDRDYHRSGLLGVPRISARVKVRGRENRGRFFIKDCPFEIWEVFLFIWWKESKWQTVNGQLNGGRGEYQGTPEVVAHWERLVEGPGEGVEVGGV